MSMGKSLSIWPIVQSDVRIGPRRADRQYFATISVGHAAGAKARHRRTQSLGRTGMSLVEWEAVARAISAKL